MDLDRCLHRIDYRGLREPTLDALTELQRQFLYHVPFENLDIHLGRPITLSLEHAYKKIIEEGRGGFCYECNHLFQAMLTGLGFEVAFHGATMLIEDTLPLEFGHMVLLTQLGEEPWLVDVGNGQSFREPMRLDGSNSVVSEGTEYRLREYTGGHVLYYLEEEEWKPRYRFTNEPQRLENFTEPCRIQQTSPESRFTRHCLASIALPDGRITLLDAELTLSREGNSETVRIDDAEDYGCVLSEYFGINLPAEAVRVLYQRIKS